MASKAAKTASKHAKFRAGGRAQEDPRMEGEAPRVGSLHPGRSTSALATKFAEVAPPPVALPTPDENEPLGSLPPMVPIHGVPSKAPNDYRKVRLPSLADIGRDKDGKVIPHVRNEETARMIAFWVIGGASERFICYMLNMRPGLLRELYSPEIENASEAANVEVATTAFRMATDGEHEGATKHWLENKAGWKKDSEEKGSIFNINIHP